MRGRFYLPIKRVLGILIFKNFINQGENIPFRFIQNETHNHCRDIIIIELCFSFLRVMNAFCTRAAVVGDGCWCPSFSLCHFMGMVVICRSHPKLSPVVSAREGLQLNKLLSCNWSVVCGQDWTA